MKTDIYGAEVLPPAVLQQVTAFLSFKDQNFAAQVKYLGLDPAHDFMHSDLSCVDFSNCDLRGFNFTGADLRDSIGVNVLWDSSTNFTNADVRGSLFWYFLENAKYFDAHPEDLETVRRLTSETWTNAILGVERLLQADKGRGSSIRIAHAVFDETKSSVVRSNVLAFMRIASDNVEDHKNFIFNVFARHPDQPGIVISGIRTLSAFYQDEMDVFSWLTAFLQNPNQDMRREAFKGLIASKHFMRGISSIREYVINSGDSLTRRIFLGRLARLAGEGFVRAAIDTEVSNFLDFAQSISSRKFEEMARKTLGHFDLFREQASYSIQEVAHAEKVHQDNVRELAHNYRTHLQALAKQYKIPFVFT